MWWNSDGKKDSGSSVWSRLRRLRKEGIDLPKVSNNVSKMSEKIPKMTRIVKKDAFEMLSSSEITKKASKKVKKYLPESKEQFWDMGKKIYGNLKLPLSAKMQNLENEAPKKTQLSEKVNETLNKVTDSLKKESEAAKLQAKNQLAKLPSVELKNIKPSLTGPANFIKDATRGKARAAFRLVLLFGLVCSFGYALGTATPRVISEHIIKSQLQKQRHAELESRNQREME